MSDVQFWMPLGICLISLFAGIMSFLLPENAYRLRNRINLASALVKLFCVSWLLLGVYEGEFYETRFQLFLEFDIVLWAGAMSLLFVSLSSVLWLVTTIYAIGYFKGTENQGRFFGFFNLCVFATTAIAMSGNLFSFLVFYELLTMTTYPLVVHKGTSEALSAGRTYLMYTVAGGSVLLFAMVWLSSLAGPAEFLQRGIVASLDSSYHHQLIAIFFLLILGFGVKAAIVPLHGWLPVAMVAPAPVSALLHAVAVVKAGAFGIMRVVYDIYGVEFCRENGLLEILAATAAITIIYGSLRALNQDDIKKRLAYSTVSQVSYILLGVATLSITASIGGILHLVHQGVMKITLFFCAGNFQHEKQISKVTQMDGLGRLMPRSMTAFTIAAFGMIGVPPTAGFISKWYIGLGSIDAHQNWVLATILLSSVLNAAYFLPPIYRAWFHEPPEEMSKLNRFTEHSAGWWLLLPPLITACLTIAMGFFAELPIFPLRWASLIAFREYGQLGG